MKIESMRTRSYRRFKVDDADRPAEARERLSAIGRHGRMFVVGHAVPLRPPASMLCTIWGTCTTAAEG